MARTLTVRLRGFFYQFFASIPEVYDTLISIGLRMRLDGSFCIRESRVIQLLTKQKTSAQWCARMHCANHTNRRFSAHLFRCCAFGNVFLYNAHPDGRQITSDVSGESIEYSSC